MVDRNSTDNVVRLGNDHYSFVRIAMCCSIFVSRLGIHICE